MSAQPDPAPALFERWQFRPDDPPACPHPVVEVICAHCEEHLGLQGNDQ